MFKWAPSRQWLVTYLGEAECVEGGLWANHYYLKKETRNNWLPRCSCLFVFLPPKKSCKMLASSRRWMKGKAESISPCKPWCIHIWNMDFQFCSPNFKTYISSKTFVNWCSGPSFHQTILGHQQGVHIFNLVLTLSTQDTIRFQAEGSILQDASPSTPFRTPFASPRSYVWFSTAQLHFGGSKNLLMFN